MRLLHLASLAVMTAGMTMVAQERPPRLGEPPTPRDTPDFKLPNGKSQREAIVKDDYKKNVEDAAQLVRLSQEVQEDLDKGDANVVSVKTLKKLDDIDRLAKGIRGRLKRY